MRKGIGKNESLVAPPEKNRILRLICAYANWRENKQEILKYFVANCLRVFTLEFN